jgi:hypothetical protein
MNVQIPAPVDHLRSLVRLDQVKKAPGHGTTSAYYNLVSPALRVLTTTKLDDVIQLMLTHPAQ